jgi:DNA-binding NarL/FixJ family response regulator
MPGPHSVSGAARLRVLIAGDQPPARAGVRLALEKGGLVVCAEVETAAAAIEAALRERPDICLLDIHMPGSGITAAAEINAKLPRTAVVVFSESSRDSELFDALRAGAVGYLPKDTDPERLPSALLGVARGEAALPRRLVARLIEEFRRDGRRRLALPGDRGVGLTSREWEVLELLRQQASTAEIARQFFISPVTVRRHIGAILRKLDVPDRAAALRLLNERSRP